MLGVRAGLGGKRTSNRTCEYSSAGTRGWQLACGPRPGPFDSVIDYLVRRAYGDPARLLDAMDLLGSEDLTARALLNRASRRAGDPIPPGLAKPFTPLDAPRPGYPGW